MQGKVLIFIFFSAMISKSVIKALYKKYPSPPQNFPDLDIEDFISLCGETYGIVLDENTITFGRMSEENPFRVILLRHICGIEKFEDHIALVTPSYILFFHRDKFDMMVHFKPENKSCWQRLYGWFKYKLLRSKG